MDVASFLKKIGDVLSERHTSARDQAETAYRIFIPLAYYLWSRSLLPESVAFVDELVCEWRGQRRTRTSDEALHHE